MRILHNPPRSLRSVLLCLILSSAVGHAAPLFSEAFDSEAAKVKVVQRSSAAFSWVDYSDLEHQAPSVETSLRLRIPEAPNRIPGSAATKGVLLSALYGTSDRSIMMLAADAAGDPLIFTGNYRMTFDMWLSLDPAATTASSGTTEGGFWTVNSPAVTAPARFFRSTSTGNWGWLSTEGGGSAGTTGPGTAGNGDAAFYTNGEQLAFRENATQDPGLFGQAFPQGSPILKTPNNQWTAVEVTVRGAHVRVKFNGVLFLDQETTLTEGAAGFGYDDLFSSATANNGASFSPNWQFGLFDNLVVESLPEAPPALEAEPRTVFTTATTADPVPGDFLITNHGTTGFSVLSAVIDGPDASQFALTPGQTFPMAVGAGSSTGVAVDFKSAIPNGLKVGRLVLTTNDPGAPVIALPLQGVRQVPGITGPALAGLPSVSVENGASTGQAIILNPGATAVTLESAVITGGNALEFTLMTALPVTLNPGGQAVLELKFTPAGGMGVRSASLDLATTDPNLALLRVPVKARHAYGPPLLAQYQLDEMEGTVFVDASGTSPDAVMEIRGQPPGFAQPSLLPTGEGTAFHFTPAESNTTGNFAHALVPHLPNVSYTMWIRPEAKADSTTSRTLLQRSSLFTTLGTLYSLNLSPSGQLFFDINKLSAESASAVRTEDGAILDGQVYHIAVTHRDENGFSDGDSPVGTRTRLYVNGALVSTDDPQAVSPGYSDYAFTSTSEGLYIGSATASGAGYAGVMDDLQIYSMELTPEQVAALYQQPGKNAFNLQTVRAPFGITGTAYNAAAGTLTLTWNSETGAVYEVQQSSGLSGWSAVPTRTNIPSAGATTSAVIPGVTAGGKNFYRIGRVSP